MTLTGLIYFPTVGLTISSGLSQPPALSETVDPSPEFGRSAQLQTSTESDSTQPQSFKSGFKDSHVSESSSSCLAPSTVVNTALVGQPKPCVSVDTSRPISSSFANHTILAQYKEKILRARGTGTGANMRTRNVLHGTRLNRKSANHVNPSAGNTGEGSSSSHNEDIYQRFIKHWQGSIRVQCSIIRLDNKWRKCVFEKQQLEIDLNKLTKEIAKHTTSGGDVRAMIQDALVSAKGGRGRLRKSATSAGDVGEVAEQEKKKHRACLFFDFFYLQSLYLKRNLVQIIEDTK
uniref:Uncharacterized protein n=1 Tax=Tanacetum cinerariifolium TaxID=118510 RepID=A0A6L2NSB3_TANCI|nr:hypothetical protein [Tanacetum cinerariifolium]